MGVEDLPLLKFKVNFRQFMNCHNVSHLYRYISISIKLIGNSSNKHLFSISFSLIFSLLISKMLFWFVLCSAEIWVHATDSGIKWAHNIKWKEKSKRFRENERNSSNRYFHFLFFWYKNCYISPSSSPNATFIIFFAINSHQCRCRNHRRKKYQQKMRENLFSIHKKLFNWSTEWHYNNSNSNSK